MVLLFCGKMVNPLRVVRMGILPDIFGQFSKKYHTFFPRNLLYLCNVRSGECSWGANFIHISCPHSDKIYVDNENRHAHSYLENNPSYSTVISKPRDLNTDVASNYLDYVSLQDWKNLSPSDVFNAFRKASVLGHKLSIDINDPLVAGLCDSVAEKCEKFEDAQLLQSIQCLSSWPPSNTVKSGKFFLVWSALDKACVGRLKSWDIETALLFVDHWYHLKIVRSTSSVKLSLKRISRKLHRLSPQEFVYLMFAVNLCRQLPPSASQFEFVYKLESICEKLSLEELSVVSMGFFKSQTTLRSVRVSDMILSRLESTFKNSVPPDSIMLASLLKVLRTSLHPSQDVKLHKTLDAILPHLKNMSLLCCLHAVLVGTNIQLFHEEVMHCVCELYAVGMKNARLKDIERLAFVLTLYNYDPGTSPCIYDAMITEVHQRMVNGQQEGKHWKEAEIHGECLLRFLSYLTLKDIFPLDLIERAMDPEFIEMVYGKTWDKIGRELLILDASLEINYPTHKKNRLNPKMREFLAKKYQQSPHRLVEGKKLSATDRLHVNILESIKSLPGAQDKVQVHQILAQFERPDIIFSTDRNGQFQECIQNPDLKSTQKLETNSVDLHVIIIGGKNYFMKLSNQPLGSVACKMSLLKKLGYKVTLIPWFEWEAIRHVDKNKYLWKKIFNKNIK